MKKALIFLCFVNLLIYRSCFAGEIEIEQIVDDVIDAIQISSAEIKNSKKHNFNKVKIPAKLISSEKKLNAKEKLILKLAVQQFMNEVIEHAQSRKLGPIVFFQGIYQSRLGIPAFKFKRGGKNEEIFELGVSFTEMNNKNSVTIGKMESDAIYGQYIFNEENDIEFICNDIGDYENPVTYFNICVSPKNGSVKIFSSFSTDPEYFYFDMTDEANYFLKGSISKASLKLLWGKKLEEIQKEFSGKNLEAANNISLKSKFNINFSHTDLGVDGRFYIFIETNADTASLKINGEEQGGRADGKYSVKRIARAGGDT